MDFFIKSFQIPATINQYLRDYQQEGVQFLYNRYTSETGAVLCDDMGLGKTVQVIAFMCSVLHKRCTKADVILTGPKQVKSVHIVASFFLCSYWMVTP